LAKLRFFEMLNRWESVLITLALAVAINTGLFFFVYLPHREDPPAAPLLGRTERTTVTTPPESTTPKTTLESTTATASPPN